jgi:nitroreductase
MELASVMRTTPATRTFTAERVGDDVLYRILDHARFAPSGGNRQGWHVIVVKDAERRGRLQELVQVGWREYKAHGRVGKVAFAPGDDRFSRAWVDLDEAAATEAPNPFADQLQNHPVLLVVCVELASLAVLDHGLPRQSIVAGASIYPFCHNVMLMARNEGLGGVMTTTVCRREPEVADLLGIPPTHAVASLIALGHPASAVTKLKRNPVESFAVFDDFRGQALTDAPVD